MATSGFSITKTIKTFREENLSYAANQLVDIYTVPAARFAVAKVRAFNLDHGFTFYVRTKDPATGIFNRIIDINPEFDDPEKIRTVVGTANEVTLYEGESFGAKADNTGDLTYSVAIVEYE